MSKRATQIIGKPVVSAATGERLGSVADLLLDDAGTAVVGLVLSQGWMKGEHVLPAESLQTLGPDAVVSRSSDLVAPRDWQQRQHRAGSAVHEEVDGRGAVEPKPAPPSTREPHL